MTKIACLLSENFKGSHDCMATWMNWSYDLEILIRIQMPFSRREFYGLLALRLQNMQIR